MDGICASRVICTELEEVLHSARTSTDTKIYSSEEKAAVERLHCLEDVDLDPSEFQQLVTSGGAHCTCVLFTEGSLSSAPLLLRLGYIRQHTSPFVPIPIAISDAFVYPGSGLLGDIENGKQIDRGLGDDRKAAAMKYTLDLVPLRHCRLAVQDTLKSRISFVDVAKLHSTVCMKKLIAVVSRITATEQELISSPMHDPSASDKDEYVMTFWNGDSSARAPAPAVAVLCANAMTHDEWHKLDLDSGRIDLLSERSELEKDIVDLMSGDMENATALKKKEKDEFSESATAAASTVHAFC